jgi:hypothetical protein
MGEKVDVLNNSNFRTETDSGARSAIKVSLRAYSSA